jgi:5-formyltetrahydrofolate cyclo-ligase
MLGTDFPQPFVMKQALRNQMREKRKSLSADLYAEKTERIHKNLESLKEYQEAEDILFYLSKDDEIATRTLIDNALKNGKNVYVPCIQGDQLIVCPITEKSVLQIGPFGVLEPVDQDDCAHPKELDLVLVPGLAFDYRGHRLGYGKGYYDRFLKQTEAFKIGLAFEDHVLSELPIEPHDVPLNLIITESQLLHPTS